MLNTQTKNFHTEGYCLFENVLTGKEISAMRNALDDATLLTFIDLSEEYAADAERIPCA